MRASALLLGLAWLGVISIATTCVSAGATTGEVYLTHFDDGHCAPSTNVSTTPIIIGDCVSCPFHVVPHEQHSMRVKEVRPDVGYWQVWLYSDYNCSSGPTFWWGRNDACWPTQNQPFQTFRITLNDTHKEQVRSVATTPQLQQLEMEHVSDEEIANMTSSELSMVAYTPAQIKFWSDFACTGDIGTMAMTLKQGTCQFSNLQGYAFLTSRWQTTTGAWELDFYKTEKFCGGRPDKIVTGTGPQCQFIKSSTTAYNSWTVQLPRGYRLKATTRMIEEEKVEDEEVEVEEEPIFVTAGPKGDTCTNGCFVTARACQDACHIDSQCIQRCTDTYSMCIKACGSFKNKLVEV